MDETYQIHVNRVARLTLPTTYQTQLENIQKSPKFEGGKAVPFPGYSVITPPGVEDSPNVGFYEHLEACQQQLLKALPAGLLIPLPPASFHLTVADLIWNGAYQEAVKANPDFDSNLQTCIAESFQQYQKSANKGTSNQWQLLGLLLFPRALAVGLVPNHELAYEQILQLRRSIYQNPGLIGLGIEQQYHLTAHISLGYFSDIPADLDRDYLANLLSSFNERWLEIEPQILTIQQVQLRKFKDMTSYERESNWPGVEL